VVGVFLMCVCVCVCVCVGYVDCWDCTPVETVVPVGRTLLCDPETGYVCVFVCVCERERERERKK